MNARYLKSTELKAFGPARDFADSWRLHEASGFKRVWATSAIACFKHGASSSFLLQAFPVPWFTGNFQMHLLVDEVDICVCCQP